eukprot:1833211-Prymnesium_polylepis.1
MACCSSSSHARHKSPLGTPHAFREVGSCLGRSSRIVFNSGLSGTPSASTSPRSLSSSSAHRCR